MNYIIFEHQHIPEYGSETKWHNRMFVILKMVRQIQNLIWHIRDGCDRTKGLFPSSPKKPSNSTSSPRRNSHCVRLLLSTLSVQTNWKRLCWKRRQPSSGSRRKRDSFAEKTPSRIGCFQGLWHWGQFTGKSVVTLIGDHYWSSFWFSNKQHYLSSDAYTYFKMEYESELKTEIFGVRRFQILDYIARGHTRTLGEVQHKSPRVSRWNQSQSWKQKENKNRLPILVGL